MAVQQELDCVSCETSFDPGPNGGFCPDCDTPHPDYERHASDDANDTSTDNSENSTESDEDASDGDDQLSEEMDSSDEESTSNTESESEAEIDDSESTEESADIQCASCGTSVEAGASFCSDCGTEIDVDETETDELDECPNCENAVSDESFCPNCGTNLDAIREADDDDTDGEASTDEEAIGDEASDDAGDADAEAEDETSDEESPSEITLVVDGVSYSLGDGDTFGRQDEAWLDDLVTASGGREEASFISGEHLEFEIGEDGVYVTDRSTNGTTHNGEPLDGARVKLDDGDALELAGRATIDVEL